MTSLTGKVVELQRALSAAEIPHAFGGALALAFHTLEPRATQDIDLNVFVPEADVRRVFSALPSAVEWNDADASAVERDGQVRLIWERTPIDLFFATHAFHVAAAARTETVEFAGIRMPILSATDLAVFKAFFARSKDFVDIERMAEAGSIDGEYALDVIAELLGSNSENYLRLATALRPPPPGPEPRFGPRST